MKTCPYCAEEIKDAAIKCRWCGSWLVDEIPAGAEGPPRRAEVSEQAPEVETPMADEKEEAAPPQATMIAPVPAPQPKAEPAPAETPEPIAQAAAATPQPVVQPAAQETPAAQPTEETKIEFTHTGSRYLLGYAPDHFGIWDRNTPQQPVETFPRNDDGWAAAWARYSAIESSWMDLRTGQKSG